MAELVIREARPDEREAIIVLTLVAYGEYAAHMPEPYWEAYRANIVATLTDVAPAAQLVARSGDAIVGTVLLYPPHGFTAPSGEALLTVATPTVRLLAVAPAARGRGVGSQLMAECVRRALELGSTALTLHTTGMMQAARRMYGRMGFVRAPEIDFRPLPDFTVEGYRLDLTRDGDATEEPGGE